MPIYEAVLNIFFVGLVLAVIVGGMVWAIMTQHRTPGYERCEGRRLEIIVRLRPFAMQEPKGSVIPNARIGLN